MEMTRFIETNDGRKPYKTHRPTATRDVALLILLLDTGLRAGEACRLNVGDVDLEGAQDYIRPYGNSGIKTKSRIVPLGKATIRVLWKYKVTLEE